MISKTIFEKNLDTILIFYIENKIMSQLLNLDILIIEFHSVSIFLSFSWFKIALKMFSENETVSNHF
jgi:hypothetical protein